MKLQETGEIEKIQRKWWKKNENCPDDESRTRDVGSKLTIAKMAGVFYTLGVGIGLALMAVVMDILWDKIRTWLVQFALVKQTTSLCKVDFPVYLSKK